MTVSAGTRLGPYEILAPLGKGGMGEVWKARDTRLGRDVAIKISAEQFSERFEREARAIAVLNHPNICHLYDVGPNYLVMELVEGTPLKGPLPLQRAIEYSGQISQCQSPAHTNETRCVECLGASDAKAKLCPECATKSFSTATA